MKNFLFISAVHALFYFGFWSQEPGVLASAAGSVQFVEPAKSAREGNPVWPRPRLVPLPATTSDVVDPVVSLSGTWQISIDPPENYWEDAASGSWQDIQVPATAASQGINPDGLVYAMKRQVRIPADYAGKRIFLRLDGVPDSSRLFVNGNHLRDHFGGFTAWSAEVTDVVAPGEDAVIVIGFERRIRRGSFYSSGICRDIKLTAVPEDYIYRFHVETDLDEQYRDAVMKVLLGMELHSGASRQVKLLLKDVAGEQVVMESRPVVMAPGDSEFMISLPVANPRKWDAEHPNLYLLEAQIVADGEIVGTLQKKIGFREIEKQGRNILVNGRVIKVRGVNRHDIHPLRGRALTEEECWEDARLLRDANVNIVRTSHYPTMEAFLEACDALGIYVDSETNISFEDRLQNNPMYRAQYLDQWADMIERDRSHPSILMWSMGNETSWGRHIKDQRMYALAEDKSRPVIFSWAHLAPLSPQQRSRHPNIEVERPFDIHSLHYAFYDSNLANMSELWNGTSYINGWGKNFSQEGIDLVQRGMPVLHDESVHVACYNLEEMARDPNARNFWGETLKRFWESLYPLDGALGMCIWAGIDQYQINPGQNSKRVHAWGLLDGWRRQKPEYWLTKKAFSPIRIDNKPVTGVREGRPVKLPVKNWFDHTNLNEVEMEWQVGDRSSRAQGPDLAPGGSEGTLTIPAVGWRNGDILELRFFRSGGLLVDEYRLPLNPGVARVSSPTGPVPRVMENAGSLEITGPDFQLTFSKETGLIVKGTYRGRTLIEGGPYLHLQGIELPDWSLDELAHRSAGREAVVEIKGRYGEAVVVFEMRIAGNGLMKTTYRLENMPYLPPVPDVALTHARSPSVGGYEEVGVSFVLSSDVDRLSWKRDGLWSYYPDDHIGRNEGTAYRAGRGSQQPFAVRPTIPWSEDERNYELFGMYDIGGRGTKDFRSLKGNIFQATAGIAEAGAGLRAESTGQDAVRLMLMDDPRTLIDDRDERITYQGDWIRLADDHRDYQGTASYTNAPGAAVEFTFEGTGVAWIGSRDVYYGNADVYLDGELQVSPLNTESGQNWDHPDGQDKEPGFILYSQEGLDRGRHTLRIVARGDESDDGLDEGFISVDAFQVLGTSHKADVKMIIANAWNYPEIGWIRWGNYTKDSIVVGTGYENHVLVKFSDFE